MDKVKSSATCYPQFCAFHKTITTWRTANKLQHSRMFGNSCVWKKIKISAHDERLFQLRFFFLGGQVGSWYKPYISRQKCNCIRWAGVNLPPYSPKRRATMGRGSLSPLPHANNNKANSGHIKNWPEWTPQPPAHTMRDDGWWLDRKHFFHSIPVPKLTTIVSSVVNSVSIFFIYFIPHVNLVWVHP